MKKAAFIFFILSINFLLAQKKKDIKENVTDFYSKNDSLPFFKFEKAELDITRLALAQVTDQYLGRICIFRKGQYLGGYSNLPEGQDAVALATALAKRIP